jgi:hypothetical protein
MPPDEAKAAGLGGGERNPAGALRPAERVIAHTRATQATAVTLATFRAPPWNGPWFRQQGFTIMPESEIGAGLRAVLIRHERFLDMQTAEGRTRPACARRPARARADRTTSCATCRTDDAGSGKSYLPISGIHGERPPRNLNSRLAEPSAAFPRARIASQSGVEPCGAGRRAHPGL